MDVVPVEGDSPNSSAGRTNEEEKWNQLPRRFLARSAIAAAISTTILGLPVLAGLGWIVEWSYSLDRSSTISFVAISWIVLLVLRVCARSVEVAQRRFALRQLDITCMSGLWNRRELVLSYSRLQEIATSSSILDRLFQLSSLNLTQANGTETIAGLDNRVANRIREYITTRVLEISRTDSNESDKPITEGIEHSEFSALAQQGNDTISVDSLSDSREPHWCRVKCLARTLVGRIASVVLFIPLLLLFLGLVLYTFWEDLPISVIFWSSWILLAFRSVIYPVLEIPRRGYAMRELDLAETHGLIATSRTNVPLTRIQHVASSSGFLDRRFGLATLTISTVGSDTSLSGLSKPIGEDLRATILQRVEDLGGDLIRDAESADDESAREPKED